jgi:hypothetical protein
VKFRIALAIALCLCTLAAWAQDAAKPVELPTAQPQLAPELAVDVSLLLEFRSLDLTTAQVKAITGLYQAHPELLLSNMKPEVAAQVLGLRNSLLSGKALPQAEFEQAVKALGGVVMPWVPGPQSTFVPQAMDALTDYQRALLAAPAVLRGAGPQTPEPEMYTQSLVGWIGYHAKTPDDQWKIARETAAAMLARGAGAPESAEYQPAATAIAAYLDKWHKLTEAQLQEQAADLLADFRKIAPERSLPLLGALGSDDLAATRYAASLFLHPRAPYLFAEMLKARGG